MNTADPKALVAAMVRERVKSVIRLRNERLTAGHQWLLKVTEA